MVTHASFVFLTQGKRIGKKKKTSVKSCNLNPYWNESFVFLIDEMDMKRVWLDVTVSGPAHCAKASWKAAHPFFCIVAFAVSGS